MKQDMQAESAYLEIVKQSIQQEIDKLLSNLKNMKEWKKENREDELSERGFFEQLQMRLVDAGVTDSRYEDTYQRVMELGTTYYAPYFGRIDFRELGFDDEEHYYVGKRGIAGKGEPLVIDWRTPIASLFYQQRLGEMSFQAPGGTIHVDLVRRRQYVIHNGVLEGMFDSAVDVQDEILQRMLSSASADRLKDVVATIQKEQDEIIRAPLEDNILLDGVAGSGKTTIILHRIAYLLFNFRAKLHNQILIVGPNQIFMEYISQVLPDLGEADGVYQRTLRGLVAEVLELKRSTMETADYFEKLRSKTQADFRERVFRKASLEYARTIDTHLRAHEKAQRLEEDLVFDGKVLLTAEEGNELFFKNYQSTPYNRRTNRIKRLINSRLRQYRNSRVDSIRGRYAQKIAKARSEGDRYLVTRLEEQREEAVYAFIEKVNVFHEKLRDFYVRVEPEVWYASTICPDDEVWVEEDLWAMLYIASRVEGIGLFSVRHLLVDEAQDVSALGFLTLQRLTGTESMTIVGDTRQKIKGEAYPSLLDYWKDALTPTVLKRTRQCFLTRSYRSTREIMEYAVRQLSEELRRSLQTIERPSAPVRFEKLEKGLTQESLLRAIEWMRQENMEHIAILTENRETARRASELLGPRAELIQSERQKSNPHRIHILPVYFAKGLEYDGVIAIDDMSDLLVHYVLCTRALHRLVHLQLCCDDKDS